MPPAGDEWLHEVTYDRYRTQFGINGTTIPAFTRHARDSTDKYQLVVRSARALRCKSAPIRRDVLRHAAGITDVGGLRRSFESAPEHLVLFAFDLLWIDRRDLRGEPLLDRRRRLLLARARGRVPERGVAPR